MVVVVELVDVVEDVELVVTLDEDVVASLVVVVPALSPVHAATRTNPTSRIDN